MNRNGEWCQCAADDFQRLGPDSHVLKHLLQHLRQHGSKQMGRMFCFVIVGSCDL
jgi:hypothetical protein